MSTRQSYIRTWAWLILIGFALVLSSCNGTDQDAQSIYAATSEVASPTPYIYLTPTPAAPLLPPGTYEAVNEAAGTATRIVQLTQVPTWPPGQPRVYPSTVPETPSQPLPTRVAGIGIIHEGGITTLPSSLGRFWNRWIAEVNGQKIKVYAGTKTEPQDQDQGIIVVLVEDSNYIILAGPHVYLTPQRRGAVKIIDAVGQRLTLRAEDGTLLYFDLPTRQWVSLPVPTPSLPPPPSAPVPTPSVLP